MPASGTFGYGEEFFEIIDYDYFGALVTKGISLKPSKGNEMPRICETSCGMINSIGLQNVGFEKFRDEKMPFLRNFKKPVIVNFFGSSIEEYAELAEKLANIGGIGALEANISCPNIKEGGRSFGSDPEVVYELVSSVKEKIGGGLPLIVKLTPMVSDISLIAEVCEKAGADIISLINTIPAAAIDIKTKKFKLNRGYGGLSGAAVKLNRGYGGLSGAAVKPVALKLVGDVYNAVRIPVIGMGGISSWEDAAEFFLAGATAVAVGTYAFVNPKIITEITAGLKNYLAENGFGFFRKIRV
jgi:dihydroorotate dehydrogenase (NAD+) catalytic subunit